MLHWLRISSARSVRFDLVTVFVGVTVWAVLLGAMRLADFPPRGYVNLSASLIVVGMSLWWFRRRHQPFRVAICAGIVLAVCGELISRAYHGLPLEFPALGLLSGGIALGGFAFFVIDGVLIVSWWIPIWLRAQKWRTEKRMKNVTTASPYLEWKNPEDAATRTPVGSSDW